MRISNLIKDLQEIEKNEGNIVVVIGNKLNNPVTRVVDSIVVVKVDIMNHTYCAIK
jgi:hypothetical protein